MRIIKIQYKGAEHECLVDDGDYGWLMLHRWSIRKAPNTFYAQTRVLGKREPMHRLVYRVHHGLTSEQLIDHEDRNGLNNQRGNLRIATVSQNAANKEKYINGASSRYKGVTVHPGGWYARVQANKRYYCVGVFDTERQAAIAYDLEARRRFGEFACLNITEALAGEISDVEKLITSPKLRSKRRSSRYHGVFFDGRRDTWGWNARPFGGKNHQRIGFDTEMEAAIERDRFIADKGLSVEFSLPHESTLKTFNPPPCTSTA